MELASLSGIQEVFARAKAHDERLEAAWPRALTGAARFLLAKSKELVPVQTGNLKASGVVLNIGGPGLKADVVVSYGDGASYAVFVHENLDAAHGSEFNTKHADEILAVKKAHRSNANTGLFNRGPNQQAKFLEQPAREYRQAMLNGVADDLSKVK